MSGDLETLEAALAASRARLEDRRGEARSTGRRPLRRLLAIARIMRGGSPIPTVSVPDQSNGVTFWRRHALDLEAEVEALRSAASDAKHASDEIQRKLYSARDSGRRLAIALARVEEEREANRRTPAPAPPDTTTDYEMWIRARAPSDAGLRAMRDIAAAQHTGPTFSVIVPVYKVPLRVLRDTVESVRRQTYPRWELCIAHGDVGDASARRYLRRISNEDPRIRVLELAANGGISSNSNAALELATGNYIVLLDHDDMIVDHALSTFASVLSEHPDCDVLYSDKDMTDATGRKRINPLLKPQWSPETMLTVNYLTHLNALRTSLVRAIGGWRPETDGAQDWDLFMRLTERTSNVLAVRDVLYRWRMIETSVAGSGTAAKPYALAAQVKTLEEAMRRRGVEATFTFEDDGLTLRPTWRTLPHSVSVVVIPQCSETVQAAADVIAARCPARVAEILIPTHESPYVGDDRVRIVGTAEGATAWQRLRAALASATSPITIVVDAGTLPPDTDVWVDDLIGPIAIPGVAVVGGKVLEAHSDRIARTGIVFHRDGTEADLFGGGPRKAYGFIGSAQWIRNVSAIPGGLFAVDTALGRELIADERSDHARADIEFSLRAVRTGHRIVYTPFVESREMVPPVLSQTVGNIAWSRSFVAAVWPDGDPHFHPDLVTDGQQQRLCMPPSRPPSPYDYGSEANALSSFYDAAQEDIDACGPVPHSAERWRDVLWILPDFSHAYYGGIATILRFAAYLARVEGVTSTFAVAGITPPDVLERRIVGAFPDLAGARFTRVTSFAEIAALPPTDVGVATLWTTAYYLLHANVERRYYFVQDNEPQFYPAGTTSALVEATYRFGFQHICNTVTLAEIVRTYGGEAVSFTPSIDPTIFHDRDRLANRDRMRLFAYARPGHPRNGFELLARALRTVKAEFGDDLDIVTAGAPWSPAAYGLDGVVTNMGLLGYRSTGDLYRSCDAGAVMMMTSHPSYLPIELMACGAAVVTNVNPRTAWLLQDEQNAFLAETTPTAFAERIATALRDASARGRIVATAGEFVREQRADWDAEWLRLTSALWNAGAVES